MYKTKLDGVDYITIELNTTDTRFTGVITPTRYAGWDVHFSAFSNDCCKLPLLCRYFSTSALVTPSHVVRLDEQSKDPKRS